VLAPRRTTTGSESFFASSVSVPLASCVGLLASPEGRWPVFGSEPGMLATRRNVFRWVSVASSAGLLAVALPCRDALVPPSLGAAELPESALATAIAAHALPTSRPAASTQIPAAKRTCDRTTTCPPTREPLPAQRLPYSDISDHWYELFKPNPRAQRSAAIHSNGAFMPNPPDQAPLTMAAAETRRVPQWLDACPWKPVTVSYCDGIMSVLLGKETSSTLRAVSAPAMGRPSGSSRPS
jgi:hypothetical protein